MSAEYEYVGEELDLFSRAKAWKDYWSSKVRPHVRGCVLEAGAGLGANTRLLHNPACADWLCLEPDAGLHQRLVENISAMNLGGINSKCGILSDLEDAPQFDSIIYIDVMEHIEHDKDEALAAMRRLKPGGELIILAPAHNYLFSPFDKSVGHFRRYDISSLRAIKPDGLQEVTTYYLDSVGWLASVANKCILKQTLPSAAQIDFWNNFLIPASKCLDPCLLYGFGKTVVSVWRRPVSV